MKKSVNIHEAKTHLSRLLVRVMGGEDVIIAKAGNPVARLIPYQEPPEDRKPGTAGKRIVIKSAFFEPLPDEVIKGFEG
jgi:prevent-host-death family protein